MKQIILVLVLSFSFNVFAGSYQLKCSLSDQSAQIQSEFDKIGSDFSLKLKLGETETEYFSKYDEASGKVDENAKGSLISEGPLKVITMTAQTLAVGADLVKISMMALPDSIQSKNIGGSTGWVFRSRVLVEALKLNNGNRIAKVMTCALQVLP